MTTPQWPHFIALIGEWHRLAFDAKGATTTPEHQLIKLDEELTELTLEVQAERYSDAYQEAGDVLFICANYLRLRGKDALLDSIPLHGEPSPNPLVFPQFSLLQNSIAHPRDYTPDSIDGAVRLTAELLVAWLQARGVSAAEALQATIDKNMGRIAKAQVIGGMLVKAEDLR